MEKTVFDYRKRLCFVSSFTFLIKSPTKSDSVTPSTPLEEKFYEAGTFFYFVHGIALSIWNDAWHIVDVH